MISLLDFWLNPRKQCQEMSWHLRAHVIQQTKRLVYWSLLDLGGNSDFISCPLIHMNRFWKFITFDLLRATCLVSHFSHDRLLVTPGTVACQTPLSMGFFRWEYWSGLPFPPPKDLPDLGIELTSPELADELLPTGSPGTWTRSSLAFADSPVLCLYPHFWHRWGWRTSS